MHTPTFIRGLGNLRPAHKGAVLTIGSFDGVHRGHQAMLRQLKAHAQALGAPTCAMTFEPQPYEFFSGERAPARLMRLRDKVQALLAEGVDQVLCLPFNARLRAMTGQQFIDQVLVQGLAIRHLVVGDDFRFGCDRSGDFSLLQAAGRQYGFGVCNTETFTLDGERVSSTRIRQALEAADFALAERLLGRPYVMTGKVVKGQQLGRTLGAPTANVHLHRYRSPLSGVYAVRARARGQAFEGVANVGVRPTVLEGAKPILEVHLFDTRQDLYGVQLAVTFCTKLRDEQKFDGLPALRAQIARDIAAGREFFNR